MLLSKAAARESTLARRPSTAAQAADSDRRRFLEGKQVGSSSSGAQQHPQSEDAMRRLMLTGSRGSAVGSQLAQPHNALRVSLIVEGVGAAAGSTSRGGWAPAALAPRQSTAAWPSTAALAAMGVAVAGEMAVVAPAACGRSSTLAAGDQAAAAASRESGLGSFAVVCSKSIRMREATVAGSSSGFPAVEDLRPSSAAPSAASSSAPQTAAATSSQQQRPASAGVASSNSPPHQTQQLAQQQAKAAADSSGRAGSPGGTAAFKGASRAQAALTGRTRNRSAVLGESPGGPGCYKAITFNQIDPALRCSVSMRPASPPNERLVRRQQLQLQATDAAEAAEARRRVACARHSLVGDDGSGGGSTARGSVLGAAAAAGSMGDRYDSPRVAGPAARLAAAAARLGVPAAQQVHPARGSSAVAGVAAWQSAGRDQLRRRQQQHQHQQSALPAAGSSGLPQLPSSSGAALRCVGAFDSWVHITFHYLKLHK